MPDKTKKAATTEELVHAYIDVAERQTNPGTIDTAVFRALIVLARGIDELKAEAKK